MLPIRIVASVGTLGLLIIFSLNIIPNPFGDSISGLFFGKYANVTISGTSIEIHNESTGIWPFVTKRCYTIVKGEIINNGNQAARNVIVNCVVKDKRNNIMGSGDTNVGWLNPNQRQVFQIKTESQCGVKAKYHDCTESCDNVC